MAKMWYYSLAVEREPHIKKGVYLMYTIYDRKDDYRATFYSKEEALAAAINHCVTEGLFVDSVLSEIEGSFAIIYIDPDDNSSQEIAIYQVN